MPGQEDDQHDEAHDNLGDQDEEDTGDHAEEEEPQTREELRQIQARFKNNRRTAAHFYHQRYLQTQMRIVYMGAQPLFEEFQTALQEQKKGQVTGQCLNCIFIKFNCPSSVLKALNFKLWK